MNQRRYADPKQDPQRWLRQVLADAQRIEARGRSVPEIKTLTGLAGRLKSVMDALQVGCAAQVAASGTTSPQKVLQQGARMSRHDANRMTRTAEGLEKLPNVKKRLEAGEITLGHAGVLVATARETGPAAVDSDTALLDRASETPEDLFAADAKRFAGRHAEDRGEAKLQRQQRRRKAALWTDPDTGMGRLNAELDPIRYGLVRQALENHAESLRREDRTGAGPEHRRSNPQRLADALVERLTGLHALTHNPFEHDHTDHSSGAGTRENPGTKDSTPGHASGENGAGDSGRCGPAARGGKPPRLVIVADIGLIDGTDPNGRCEIPGTGPVPPSILETLSPDTKITGIIFSGDGQPLWLGRSRRDANAHQHLAVAVRDRGCVQCGAPMHQCHIHHTRPWEQGGPTDIDNLQALCAQHHRQHHGPHQPNGRRSDPRNGPGQGSPGSRRDEQHPPPRPTATQTAQPGPRAGHTTRQTRKPGRRQKRPSQNSSPDDDAEQRLPL